eukprot:g13487.t1
MDPGKTLRLSPHVFGLLTGVPQVCTLLFTSPAAVQPKASEAAPKLSEEEKQRLLRGVQVASAAEYTAKGQTLPPSKRVSTTFKDPPPGQIEGGTASRQSGVF